MSAGAAQENMGGRRQVLQRFRSTARDNLRILEMEMPDVFFCQFQGIRITFHSENPTERTLKRTLHGDASCSGTDIPDNRIRSKIQFRGNLGADFFFSHGRFSAYKRVIRQRKSAGSPSCIVVFDQGNGKRIVFPVFPGTDAFIRIGDPFPNCYIGIFQAAVTQ